MKIDVNGVSITLTKEQLEEIKKQTSKPKIEDINSYIDACDILNQNVNSKASITEQIQTIAKAFNYIDNGYKHFKFDFENKNEYKYYPIYENTKNGLVFSLSTYYRYSYHGTVAFFISKKSSDIFGIKFKYFYQQLQESINN